ncbi:hypothetical protein [Paenisporosarcina sp. TG20]|uniref:hypothetical protein n=1 Tax=Paenisporosarcina sp. TG20 TaxID=1211706 RepID=UPI0003087F82|nr:hypothetical protein [Paenisporosarcina sp. TG20]
MDDITGTAMVIFLFLGFAYGLVRQIQHTLTIRLASGTDNYKRLLLGNYLTCVSMAGFLISYVLNVVVSLEIIQSQIFTSNNTNAGCFIFLALLLISKFGITPKRPRPIVLLNKKFLKRGI